MTLDCRQQYNSDPKVPSCGTQPAHISLTTRRHDTLDTQPGHLVKRSGGHDDGRGRRFTLPLDKIAYISAHNPEIAASNPVPLTLSRSAACEVRCQRTAGLKDRLGTAGNRLVCLFRRSIVRCNLLLGLASGCGMVGCRADVMREADRAARLGRPRLRWWLRVMWRRRLAG